ncbi:MAG TPA: 3-dehydroquinate synthase [Polyangia bacterium]|nr:3-dehydroquinate synthase [Polyangia bacterium]
MTGIRVELGARSYEVVVAADTTDLGAAAARALGTPRPGALLADRIAHGLHGARFRAALEQAGFAPLVEHLIAGGEASKTLATVESACEHLAQAGLDRGSPVFVLGGGVTGDIGGFVAATFLRGVPLVQLPTTLLAQTDAAIGGKTGVNLSAGKNLVGAFWQPRLVYADVSTLATLPPREVAAGLAEVVKYGLIADPVILDLLESQPVAPPLLSELVARSAAIKAQIVSRDEREAGERTLLNFGHTVGHAIEVATSYTTLLHGEAVALGMLAACRVSAALGGDPALEGRLRALLTRLGLPTELEPYLHPHVLAHMATDKKHAASRVRFVVCERAGRARTEWLEMADVERMLRRTAGS